MSPYPSLRRLVTFAMATAAGSALGANDWVNLLAQDPASGLVAGRLCYSTNGHDISCDAGSPLRLTSDSLYVPTFTTTNINATGIISATGADGTVSATNGYFAIVSATTVSASSYYGDGSHLAGVGAGDRIVSGSLLAIANSTTGYISLTTGVTNWGYLSSAGSYLPTLTASGVSSTNISVTTGQYSYVTLTALAGGGGNYIASGTTSVSTSNAGGGAVRIATNGTLTMTISGSNVGIGTATPMDALQVNGAIVATGSPVATSYPNRIAITGGDGTTIGGRILFGDATGWGLRFATRTGSTNTDLMTINDNGNVGIGTTSPNARLGVNGSISATFISVGTTVADPIASGVDGAVINGRYIDIYNSASNPAAYFGRNSAGSLVVFYAGANNNVGNISVDASGSPKTSYNTVSDRRLKEHIAETSRGLAQLDKMKVVDFNFISDKSKTRVQGFIAQDLYKAYPEAVTLGGDDPKTNPWTVDYGRITPIVVKAVQELKADNDNLQRQIDELKAAIKK